MCCSYASSRDIQLRANRVARGRLRGSLSIGWRSRTPCRGRFFIETSEIAPKRDRSRRSGFSGWIAFCVDPIGPRFGMRGVDVLFGIVHIRAISAQKTVDGHWRGIIGTDDH